jgi:K+-sensing histidine kinase KdpD
VRDDELCICLQGEQDQVVLRLTDTGRPIQAGFEHDIMTLAPQWQHRQAGARTSVALGLPFIHVVAKTLGGNFTAQSSADGRRTTFTFSLPAL